MPVGRKESRKFGTKLSIKASIHNGVNNNTERCLSGRKEQFAKLSYWQRYRGFESLSLRKEMPPA